MLRRLLALVGLVAVLAHAGLVALHRASPEAAAAAASRQATADAAGELARALASALCRPGTHSGSAEAPGSLPPASPEDGTPCLACCCPSAPVLALPGAWHAGAAIEMHVSLGLPRSHAPATVASREGERPPVRAPPALG